MTAITVVICSLDRRESLLATLESLRAQRCDRPWEVLVVDNGSSDGTSEAVAGLAQSYPVPLRVVREEQRGLSRARNRALAEARGEALLFIDDDMRLHAGFVAAHAEALSDPAVAGTGGRILPVLPQGTPEWFAGLTERDYGGPVGRYDFGPEPAEIRRGGPVPTPFGGNMGVRRDLARALGGFRTELGWGARRVPSEELEFFRRVQAAGHRLRYVPGAAVDHLVQREHTTWEYYRRWQLGFGRSWVIMDPPRGPADRLGKSWTAARNLARWWLRGRMRRLRGDELGTLLARKECARFTGRLLELLGPDAGAGAP